MPCSSSVAVSAGAALSTKAGGTTTTRRLRRLRPRRARITVYDHFVDTGNRTEPRDHRRLGDGNVGGKKVVVPTDSGRPIPSSEIGDGQQIIITVGGFLPQAPIRHSFGSRGVDQPDDQPQQVVFDHFRCPSPVIPPGGTFSWKSAGVGEHLVPLGLRHARRARPQPPGGLNASPVSGNSATTTARIYEMLGT